MTGDEEIGTKKSVPMTYLQLLLEEARDGIPEEKKKKRQIVGQKDGEKVREEQQK